MNLKIEGAEKVVEWFGKWPSFHDAEIIELHLVRYGASQLKIHTWNTLNEVDEKGYYITDKHAVVTFTLTNIIDLEVFGFSQNVIFDLDIEKTEQGYKVTIESSYGLAGFLEAENISVDIYPGKS